MQSFKSFDHGRTYINLDRVEMFSTPSDPDYSDISFIRLVGVERALTVNMPLPELLRRLEISVCTTKENTRKRDRETLEMADRDNRESLGLRDLKELQRESWKRAAEELARLQQKQELERKPPQREKRSRKRDASVSA